MARRKHSKEFRAEVIQACREPGASVAAIALRCELKANVVYRWLREETLPVHADGHSAGAMLKCLNAQFIAVQLSQPSPAATPSTDIRVEVVRGASSVTVSWPLQGAGECAAWLREWLR